MYGRKDGEDLGSVRGGGVDSRAGGCFAVLTDDLLIHAAGEDGKMQLSSVPGSEKILTTAGLRVLVSGSSGYILTRDRLFAVDRAAYLELGRLQAKRRRTAEEEKRYQELASDRKAYRLRQRSAGSDRLRGARCPAISKTSCSRYRDTQASEPGVRLTVPTIEDHPEGLQNMKHVCCVPVLSGPTLLSGILLQFRVDS